MVHVRYDTDINTSGMANDDYLPTNFYMPYSLTKVDIPPHGFSGAAVFVNKEPAPNGVWSVSPHMVGAVQQFANRKGFLCRCSAAEVLMTWRRRKTPAWPDAIYFFGCIVLIPLLDVLLGHPLRWMDGRADHLHGKPSNFFEFVVVLIPLYWLDPIGRIMGIPGDAAFKNPDGKPKKLPMSKGQQAVLFLCIAIGLTAAMAGIVAGIMYLNSVSTLDHQYYVVDHEAVLILFFMLGLATVTAWGCTLGMFIGALQDAAEDRKRAR